MAKLSKLEKKMILRALDWSYKNDQSKYEAIINVLNSHSIPFEFDGQKHFLLNEKKDDQ